MSEKIYIQIGDEKQEAKGAVLEQILKDRADYEAEKNRIEAELQAKEELKQSAIAKLAAIGLTEEEAKIIIGIG